MTLMASDPLALLSIQAGKIKTPSKEKAAVGASKLDTPQRAVEIGEPIPVVFARRRNNAGGVLISPGATEARFTNNSSNAVTAYYHLILSEGVIDKIKIKDVYQRYCRVGDYNQSYDRRAGSWSPGNAIVQRVGYELPECPYYCGTVGFYTGMSTMSFQSPAYPNGSDLWNRQVHAFIRGGINVTRLFDNTSGPSDNFADLVKWIWTNSARVPALLIDDATLQDAAVFLEATGLTCNCYLTESQNVSDLIAKWAPYFLLGESNVNGKKGLRPVLPVTSLGAINTSAISPEYLFTENEIIPGSFEVEYNSVADRQPFVAQVIWRQQLDDDAGIIRTAEVRYSGTSGGPYESHDLSAFCTSEAHAVKIGAYILAKRLYTSHTLRFTARPQQHNTVLSPGSIVRVKLARDVANAGSTYHDWLYQVERISRSLSGDVAYECTHFPIDSSGRSLVALAVTTIQPSGILLTSNRSGLSCDVNSSTNNGIPSDTGQNGSNLGTGIQVLNLSGIDGGLESAAPSDSTGSADDGLDANILANSNIQGNAGSPGTLAAGAGIVADPVCAEGTSLGMKWFRNDQEVKGLVQNVYVIGSADIQVGGSRIVGVWYCSTPSGGVTETPTQEYFVPYDVSAIVPSSRQLGYSAVIEKQFANGTWGWSLNYSLGYDAYFISGPEIRVSDPISPTDSRRSVALWGHTSGSFESLGVRQVTNDLLYPNEKYRLRITGVSSRPASPAGSTNWQVEWLPSSYVNG